LFLKTAFLKMSFIYLALFFETIVKSFSMKTFLLAGFSAVVLLTSCSTTNNPSSSDPYPQPGIPNPGNPGNPNGDQTKPYPYPAEGQRDGQVVIIKGGNNDNYKNLPPGQAKKRNGDQSARVYAPGQRKKNGNNGYGVPTVISVPDNLASRSNSGQLYYNYRGKIYWKQNDGYYHLEGTAAINSNDNYNGKIKKNKNKKSKG